MTSLLLNSDEIADLTERTYAKHQIAWLTANGWQFEVSGHGRPKVLRSYAEQRMGMQPVKTREGPRLDKLAKV